MLTLTEVDSVTGEQGNFEVKLIRHPRYVDMQKCIACGVCAGKGCLPLLPRQDPAVTKKDPPKPPPPPPAEFWPILVVLGVFALFFVFLST